jgi:hypothetical protein
VAVAALLISIVAILVAGAAAWFSRRQAVAQEASHHRQSAPTIELELDYARRPEVLLVSHRAGPDLESIELEVVPRSDGSRPIESLAARGSEIAAQRRLSLGALRAGESLEVIPSISATSSGPVNIRVECHPSRGHPWILVREVVVKPEPQIF